MIPLRCYKVRVLASGYPPGRRLTLRMRTTPSRYLIAKDGAHLNAKP